MVRASLLVLGLTLVACAKAPERRATAPSTEIAFTAPAVIERRPIADADRGTTLILLDRGKSPHTLLRYRAAPGDRALTRVRYLANSALASTEMGGATLPTGKFEIGFDMEVTVQSIDDAGNYRLRGRALSLSVLPLDVTAETMVKHPTYRLPEEPPTVDVTMTPHGHVLTSKGDSAMAVQYANLRSLSVPFPTEPVGVGARWRVVQTYEKPFEAIEEIEWRLVAWDGRRARLDARAVWHQGNMSMRSPEGNLALRLEGEASWVGAVVLLDAPPIVESGISEMELQMPFEGTVSVMRTRVTSTLSVP